MINIRSIEEVPDDIFDVFVCEDCGFYLANGELDDTAPGWSAAKLENNWRAYRLVNGDSEKDDEFSKTPCEGCGSPLAGRRMHCVAWKDTAWGIKT